MEIRLVRVLRRLAGSIAAIIALFASVAARADVCVSCAGPDAAYACTVADAPMQKDDARYKFLCITELARLGGHQSCAVSRAVTAPCTGEQKTIAAPVGDELLSASPPAETSTPPTAGPPSNQATTATVPKTATQRSEHEQGDSGAKEGDAAEKTDDSAPAKSAGNAMEKAGKAVTDAAKTTWKCLSTLFGDC